MTQTTSAPHHGHRTAPPAARHDAVVEAAVQQGLLGEGDPVAGFIDTEGYAPPSGLPARRLRRHARVLHTFAAKACSLIPVLRLLAGSGMGCEVASPGELRLALDAGFPASLIVLDSPAKTREEIRLALALGVAVNADSLAELRRIDALQEPEHDLRARAAGQPSGGRWLDRADEHGDGHVEVRGGPARPGGPRGDRGCLPGTAVVDPAARPCGFPGLPVGADRGRGGPNVRAGRGDQRHAGRPADHEPGHRRRAPGQLRGRDRAPHLRGLRGGPDGGRPRPLLRALRAGHGVRPVAAGEERVHRGPGGVHEGRRRLAGSPSPTRGRRPRPVPS